MTNEQREAIDRLKDDIKYADMRDTVDDDCTICFIDDLDTALSLIKEQQEEIGSLQKELNEENKRSMILANNDKFKEQVIDLMADKLVEAHEWFYSEFDNFTKEDFIQYFADKAKGQ